MATQTLHPNLPIKSRLVSLMTADEYRQLPETNRISELVHGEVVMAPSPRRKHQLAAFELAQRFSSFVKRERIGAVYVAPFDVYLSTYEVYQPDIVVVLRSNASRLTEEGVVGAPDLVVEVLSPSNRRHDLVVKAAEYAAAGVGEYWVVDPSDDRIEVYRLDEGAYSVVASTDEIARSVILSGFEVAPADIFTMPEWMTTPTASEEE